MALRSEGQRNVGRRIWHSFPATSPGREAGQDRSWHQAPLRWLVDLMPGIGGGADPDRPRPWLVAAQHSLHGAQGACDWSRMMIRSLAALILRQVRPSSTTCRYSAGRCRLVARDGRLRRCSEPACLLRSKRPDQHLDCDAVGTCRTHTVPLMLRRICAQGSRKASLP